MNTTAFKESQRFRQWWVWIPLIGLDLVFVFQIYQNLILEKDLSNLVFLVFFILINLLFYFVRLETLMDKEGIHYRFHPFFMSKRLIRWEDMNQVYVRKYNAILEYGGWGYRLGIFGRGKAFNTSGNQGIQIYLKSGKRILIGTQLPNEADEYLKQNGYYHRD